MNLNNKTYFPLLDWLRFFLAFIVLIVHMGIIENEIIASFAVEIFFALSGWLIGSILMKTNTSQLNRFYFNRAIRIWLPYFISFVLIIVASLLHKDELTKVWFEVVFYKLTFVYNWFGTPMLAAHVNEFPLQGTGNHFWSVNIEEQFYLFAPLLLVLTNRRFGKSLIVWSFFGLLAYAFQMRGVSIIFGVIASIVASQYGNFYEKKMAKFVMFVIIFLSLFAFQQGNDYMLIAPWCAVAVVLFLAIEGKQGAIGKFAGGISYELYINAWIGGFLANALFKLNQLQNIEIYYKQLITITLSIMVATILYYLIDKRILDRRDEFFDERKGYLVKQYAYYSLFVGIIVGIAFKFAY